MATLTLEYDGRSTKAKKAIEYILSLGIFKKKEEKAYNPDFVKMVLDADKEESFEIKDVDAFMKSLC